MPRTQSGRGRGLSRLGTSCARHPALVIVTWLLVLAALGIANRYRPANYRDDTDMPGSQAHAGAELLAASDPEWTAAAGRVVFHIGHGTLHERRPVVEEVVHRLAGLPHVLSASDPFSVRAAAVSPDGHTAYSTVRFGVSPRSLGAGYLGALNRATAAARNAGIQVEYGAALGQLTKPLGNHASEVIGFVVALIVLLVVFGSVFAAVLPLLAALVSTLLGLGVLGLVAGVVSFGTAAPTLAIMIGFGVGIDYALFLTTRFRRLIAAGTDPARAAGSAAATSGRAVLIAAGMVTVALLSLYVSGVTFVGQLGFAAVFTVLTAAAGAVTLVPAALALLGRGIDRARVRRPVTETAAGTDMWHRYADAVTRRPWRFFALGMLLLTLLSAPVFALRLGHVDEHADPASFTDRRAFDLVSHGFGPGANAPMAIVVDVRHATAPPAVIAGSVRDQLAAVDDVARVSALTPSRDGTILMGTVIPGSGPQDPATGALLTTLVHDALPHALRDTGARGYVTGSTAAQLEFRHLVASKLPVIIATVVLAAFLLILLSFRSVLIAVKAAVLNVLSIGAAYGVVVAVFQWGWGRGWLGVSQNVPIESYVPMTMFAIVFGLSMDYEVFLLARVKEAFDHTRDNADAVRIGLASTGRVITSAALIMISVFLAFVTSHMVAIKMLAVGLAVSVLIDATVVRMLLVPATMTLFASKTWWMPAWLDRILPRLSPEADAEPAVRSPGDRGAGVGVDDVMHTGSLAKQGAEGDRGGALAGEPHGAAVRGQGRGDVDVVPVGVPLEVGLDDLLDIGEPERPAGRHARAAAEIDGVGGSGEGSAVAGVLQAALLHERVPGRHRRRDHDHRDQEEAENQRQRGSGVVATIPHTRPGGALR